MSEARKKGMFLLLVGMCCGAIFGAGTWYANAPGSAMALGGLALIGMAILVEIITAPQYAVGFDLIETEKSMAFMDFLGQAHALLLENRELLSGDPGTPLLYINDNGIVPATGIHLAKIDGGMGIVIDYDGRRER